ncbi:MAG: hypothetical protein AB4290_08705 [Spirulina sp.]
MTIFQSHSLPITDYRLPITDYPLPITHYPLPIYQFLSLFLYLHWRENKP